MDRAEYLEKWFLDVEEKGALEKTVRIVKTTCMLKSKNEGMVRGIGLG